MYVCAGVGGTGYNDTDLIDGDFQVVQSLVRPDGELNDRFGWDVAVDGDTIMVFSDSISKGVEVFVYRYRETQPNLWQWQWVQTLSATDDMGGMYLASMALDGESAAFSVTGLPNVVVFERDAFGHWELAHEIPDYESGSVMVDLDGDRLLLCDAEEEIGTGAAYVYRRAPDGQWLLAERIPAPAAAGDVAPYFGYHAALSGETALIGSLNMKPDYTADPRLHVYDVQRPVAGASSVTIDSAGQHVWALRRGEGVEPVNLALGGLTTQSSTYGTGHAQRAIDGDTDGVYDHGSVTHTQNDLADAGWEVDLCGRYELTEVVLHNRQEAWWRLSNFRVSVFDGDEEVFGQNYYVGSGSAPAGAAHAVALPGGVYGTRVRVQLLGPSNDVPTDGYLSLAEVEVFGYEAPRDAVAMFSRHVEASDIANKGEPTESTGAFAPHNAIDGDTSTFSKTLDEPDSWWQLAYDERYDISRIVLSPCNATPEWTTNLRVTLLDGDMEVWGADVLTDRVPGWNESLPIDLPAGTVGDRVKVQLLGTNLAGSGILALGEVSVTGAPADERDLVFIGEVHDPSILHNASLFEPSPDGSLAFVATDAVGFHGVALFDVDPDDGTLAYIQTVPLASGGAPTAFKAVGDRFYVAQDDGALNVYRIWEDSIEPMVGGPAIAVDGVTAIAAAPDGATLYVARGEDEAISVYRRNTFMGGLTFVQEVRSGVAGVRGLGGVCALAASADRLFAVGRDDDSLVVFNRNAGGSLAFVQRVRNGSGGVRGLDAPNAVSVSPDGRYVYVSSGGGPAGANGGVAWFEIDAQAGVPAPPLRVGYGNMSALHVISGDKADDVVLRGTRSGSLTLDTGDGSDTLLVQATPECGDVAVIAGGGDDTVAIWTTGSRSSLWLDAGGGSDAIALHETDEGSTVHIYGGEGEDRFTVAGAAMTSAPTVHGGLPALAIAGGGSDDPGDLLVFHGQPDSLEPDRPDGSIAMDQVTKTRYTGIEAFDFVTAVPLADAGGSYTIDEGGSLALDASGSIVPPGQEEISLMWDVDGDGVFGDLVGRTPSPLAWDDLRGYGIVDSGDYRIAVGIETDGGVDLGRATLRVEDTPPRVTIAGDAATAQHRTYTLGLDAIDPGDDAIRQWIIDWGDGTGLETLAGNPPFATHVYRAPGLHTVQAWARDEDGGPYAAASIELEVIDVPPHSLIEGGDTANEGEPYALALHADNTMGEASWVVDWGDGTPTQTVDGPAANLVHTFADDSARAKGGRFRIVATLIDADGVYTASKDVTVANRSPQLSVDPPAPIVEGDRVTIYFDADDPGDDRIASWTIEWGDGATSIVPGGYREASHRYAQDSTGQGGGAFAVTVSAADEDGPAESPVTVPRVVANADPTVTALEVPAELDEAAPGVFFALADDPGDDALTCAWTFGDGTEATGQSVRHAWADDGVYAVTLTVTDPQGGWTAETRQVHVRNVAPVIAAPAGARQIDVGRPLVLSATAGDVAGPADPLAFAWTFGDGTPPVTGIGLADVSHTYNASGEYVVTLTVDDDDGGVALRSVPVTVRQVAPPLNVEEVIVGDGGPQRSAVASVSVRFSEPNNLGSLIDSGLVADIVRLVDGAGSAIPLTPDRYRYDPVTRLATIDLTVDGVGGSGDPLLFTGRYSVHLVTNEIVSGAGQPLEDIDGTRDGVFRSHFHVLPGDYDGDAVVTEADRDLFMLHYHSLDGDARYDPLFDSNDDGRIDGIDYYAWRRLYGDAV